MSNPTKRSRNDDCRFPNLSKVNEFAIYPLLIYMP